MNTSATSSLAIGIAILSLSPAAAWPWSSVTTTSEDPTTVTCAGSLDKMTCDTVTSPSKEEDAKRLRAKAEELVPFVEAAQADRLAKFREKYDADVASFGLRAERWGDFLAVYVDRDGKKTVQAINLGPASTPVIKLVPGHPPDLLGTERFTVCHAHSDNDNFIKSLSFDDVKLPTKECVLWMSGTEINDLPSIHDAARNAEDDKIVFGQGGPTTSTLELNWYWKSSSEPATTYSTPTQEQKSVPGYTLSVPAGLGDKVYADILNALAKETKP